jgi:Cu-Zn family superoxide dismutase
MIRILSELVLTGAVFLGSGPLSVAEAESLKAICKLKPTQGHQVTGFVKFTQRKNSVKVWAHVEGLTPGKHGFHIHECGDCSAPDGSSAKGHFNPGKNNHGGPGAKDRHAGDLGNLNANSKGVAEYENSDKNIHLTGDDSIIGKAVIIHEKMDDYKTQPTGNSGARAACGVIVTKEEFQKNK